MLHYTQEVKHQTIHITIVVQTIYLVATAELTGVVGSSCSASKVMSNPLRPKKCNMSCISIMSIPIR